MSYTPAERKLLTTRWSEVQLSLLNSLLCGYPDKGTGGVLEHDQRLDLRGLSVTANLLYRRFSAVDFSCCRLKDFGQFNDCTFRDCLFVLAQITNNLSSSFESCLFQEAKLSEVTVGESFSSCDFRGSRWSRVLAVRTTFRGCSFAGARLDRARLVRCKFDSCDLTGAELRRCELEHSQFTNSTISPEQLIDTYLEGVELPS